MMYFECVSARIKRMSLVLLMLAMALMVSAQADQEDAADEDDQTEIVQAEEEKMDESGNIRDAWIDHQVESAFILESSLRKYMIDTDVREKTVYLSGTVRTEQEKARAGKIAARTEGVGAVENNLEVNPELESETADPDS